jgi:TnpA family transposase
VEKSSRYPTLERIIGGAISTKQITTHWDEALRLAASIQHGTVTASLMLRKLGAYPRQNALALALREIGKLERTLFLLGVHPEHQTTKAHSCWPEQRGSSQRTD